MINHTCTTIYLCDTSQFKYVFKLDKNVPHVMGQNFFTPQGDNNLNFLTWLGKFVYQPTSSKWCFHKLFVNKPLNDWSHKKQWVFVWNKTHCLPWGQSLSAFQSMIMHGMFALIRLAWKVSVAFEFRWKRKCGWIFPSSHFYQCGKRRFWFWILNMFSSCHWMNLMPTMVYMVI